MFLILCFGFCLFLFLCVFVVFVVWLFLVLFVVVGFVCWFCLLVLCCCCFIFFVVFSCGGGDGPGELEVSRANFFLEEESFRALGTLSQAKSMIAITSKHTRTSVMMQACRCRAKLFETLTNKASENC